ncbi:MAG: hypothetical protein QOC54_2769, partial [Baekduia sp.]|nr:hypothetical protein [Baekduia sp.]
MSHTGVLHIVYMYATLPGPMYDEKTEHTYERAGFGAP